MSTTHLKIKIKSLAAESQMIRQEQKKFPGPSYDFQRLYLHRTIDVRNESRASLIAYGYLRGKAYLQIEPKCHVKPNWKRAEQIAKKFHPGVFDAADFKVWQEEMLDVKKAA